MKMWHCSLAIAVVLTIFPAWAASDYASLLHEADSARTTDRARFVELLDALHARDGEADSSQKQHLRYLDAYRLVVYGNAVRSGITEAESLFKDAKNIDLKFRAGALAANSHAIVRNFADSLRYINQIAEIRHQVKDKDVRHDGMNAAAIVYNRLEQYRLGLQYAEETASDAPSPRQACVANFLRVEAKHHLGLLQANDTTAAKAVVQCDSIGELMGANFARLTLARHLASHGKQDEAIKLLDSHMSEVDGIGYAWLIAEFRALLAELGLARGENAAAADHARRVIAQADKIQGTEPLVVAYRTLYRVAEAGNDAAATLERYRDYAEAERAWLNEVKAREMAYQIVRQEMGQKSQQIELLNRQNEVLTLQQEVQKQNAQNSRLLMLLLVMLLASTGYWAYKTKRVQMSLRRMAETDALTGISNRHHFTQQSELALAQCARAGEDAALVMFDLDHFKSINDRYGHDTGDWVLKRVAAICAPLCRQVDFFGRIGGEEFAMLLIGIDARGAKRLAEDCRVRIAGVDSGETGYRFKPTASFGVTTTALSGHDLAKLLSHADKMLYRAKHAGRNRVFVYEIPVPVQLPVPVGNALDAPLAPESMPAKAAEVPVADRRIAAAS